MSALRGAAERPLLPQVASAIVEIRRHLPLAAPSPTFRHLAFGSGFLVQLRDASVRLLKSADGSAIAEVPLARPRVAVALPAGSVLACGSDECQRFDPGQVKPHRLGRISLLPDAILEPSRETQERVWVIEPTFARAVRYTLGEPTSEVESTSELPGYDRGAITTLADGAFLYTAGQSVVRALGRARRAMPLPDGVARPWRLLPAERADRAWVISAQGEAFLLELTGRAHVLRRFATEGHPFDVASAKAALALVSIHEDQAEERTFVLNLYSAAGTQTKSYLLGKVGESADPEWAAMASRDREVVLAERPPRVAVGGSTALRLFELVSGDEIVTR
ncbi:MAG TPA: hypothetical protein VFQ35_10150 [Polyangiaceae bacterium]|nr:hypothetical protein [Polyangiaceae bacterium]